MKSIEKLREVIDSGLCTRCGSCVGLSDGKIIFEDREGMHLPKIKKEIDDKLADRLWLSCPGKEVNFKELNKFLFGRVDESDKSGNRIKNNIKFHEYLGSYRTLNIGYSENQKIRRAGASGGILTSILLYLLEIKKIDGAVVLGMSKEKPWLAKAFIATTAQEIISAAQSKYTISSVNEILPEIMNFKGRLAYIGLPWEVHSIRKLMLANDPSVKNIKYIFGPFCGNVLYFSSIISFLKAYKIYDYKEIAELKFREGEWPGNMKIALKSGKVIMIQKFHANYLIPFHIERRSLFCTDLTNEFTDISGGDAWAPVYEERGKGFSTIIGRTKKGVEILKDMEKEGKIKLLDLSEEQAIKMHSHAYDFKKRGAFIRIRFAKFLGMKVPDYGYEIQGFSIARYIMELMIDIIFIVCSTKLARYIVEKIPPSFMGKIFVRLRDTWKWITKDIKRQDLYKNS